MIDIPSILSGNNNGQKWVIISQNRIMELFGFDLMTNLKNSDFDVETAASDQELSSWAVSYTVSDEISVTYGEDTIEKGGDPTDAEYSVISGSYTAGGMTISASMKDGENINHGTASNQDFEYWSLGASFAF